MLYNNVCLSRNTEIDISKITFPSSEFELKFQVTNADCSQNSAPFSGKSVIDPENDRILTKYQQAWRELADL
ncbi:MAG: hypothetical protein AB9891_07810 [Anaerolineaceae bacterium]